MAQTNVLLNAQVTIDDVPLTGETNVAITMSNAVVDTTAMGDSTRKSAAGLTTWSMTVDVLSDAAITAGLFAKLGTSVAVKVIADASSAISVTNPSYEGNAILSDYTPMSGGVGEKNATSFTLSCDGPLSEVTTAE